MSIVFPIPLFSRRKKIHKLNEFNKQNWQYRIYWQKVCQRHIKIIHTISNSLGWVSIYTRASASCESTFEDANEPLIFSCMLQQMLQQKQYIHFLFITIARHNFHLPKVVVLEAHITLKPYCNQIFRIWQEFRE